VISTRRSSRARSTVSLPPLGGHRFAAWSPRGGVAPGSGVPTRSGQSLSLICGRSRRRGLGPTRRVLDLLGIQQQALESALEQGRRIPVIAVAPINTTLTCSQRRQADSPKISAVRVSMLRLPDPSRVVHEFLPEIRMCDRNQLESPLSESFAH
jgi:hypothetical protein